MFRNSSHSNENLVSLVELIETAFVYSSRVFTPWSVASESPSNYRKINLPMAETGPWESCSLANQAKGFKDCYAFTIEIQPFDKRCLSAASGIELLQ